MCIPSAPSQTLPNTHTKQIARKCIELYLTFFEFTHLPKTPTNFNPSESFPLDAPSNAPGSSRARGRRDSPCEPPRRRSPGRPRWVETKKKKKWFSTVSFLDVLGGCLMVCLCGKKRDPYKRNLVEIWVGVSIFCGFLLALFRQCLFLFLWVEVTFLWILLLVFALFRHVSSRFLWVEVT